MPKGKVYVVDSPDLVMAVQRDYKRFQFAPFAVKFTARVAKFSKQCQTLLETNVDCREGEWGLHVDLLKAQHAALEPGPGLDEMKRVATLVLEKSFDTLAAKSASARINLMDWLRDEFVTATSAAVYGPVNPLADRTLQDSFW